MTNKLYPDQVFSVDDVVYYIHFPLLIKCKITKVDDYFRKQHPGGNLFYDIDEPVGHSLPDDELTTSFEEARQQLREWFDAELKFAVELEQLSETTDEIRDQLIKRYKSTTLENDRANAIKFIKSTNNITKLTNEQKAEFEKFWASNPYPHKEYGFDWWNVLDFIIPPIRTGETL